MNFLWAFLVGGTLCAAGQEKTAAVRDGHAKAVFSVENVHCIQAAGMGQFNIYDENRPCAWF